MNLRQHWLNLFNRLPKYARLRNAPIAIRLIGGLLLLAGAGTLLLLLPGVSTTRFLTLDQALFTSVSAVTVTGLSTITPSQDLTLFGQLVLLTLIQIGGVGFMVVAVLVLRALGMRVTLIDRLALRYSLGLTENVPFLPVLRRVMISSFMIESVGAMLLWLNWREQLGEQAVFYAIFHAVSAFCNAGFDLFTGLTGYPQGVPRDTATLTILGALIVIGGLGLPVLSEVVRWPNSRRLSLHTRLTMTTALILIIAGAFGILLAESQTGGSFVQLPLVRRVVLAVFQSVSTRTAGFNVLPSLAFMVPATQWIMIVLMFIGSGPASMGGGITTGTLVILTLTVWSYARGGAEVQVLGRTIPRETIRRASAVLVVALLVVIGSTFLILMTQKATLDSALFEVVSAFSTCGLSLDLTGRLDWFGQIVIMFVMLWGRLGTLTVVLSLAQQRPPERVVYPEEPVFIG